MSSPLSILRQDLFTVAYGSDGEDVDDDEQLETDEEPHNSFINIHSYHVRSTCLLLSQMTLRVPSEFRNLNLIAEGIGIF